MPNKVPHINEKKIKKSLTVKKHSLPRKNQNFAEKNQNLLLTSKGEMC